MGVIAAVLHDLYTFAFVYRFGFKSVKIKKSEPQVENFVDTLRQSTVPQLKSAEPFGLLPEMPPTLTIPAAEEPRFESIGYAYTPDTLLYALPTRSFDGVIMRIPYGSSFQVLGTQGKWCSVRYGDVRGWILRDDVTERSAELQPQFLSGEIYEASHPTALKLRTVIDDAFHAAVLDLPLQDVEYVSYRLKQKGRRIDWPPQRPRIAGTWQRLLRGTKGVHMGVSPKTGSVMEYVRGDNTGHVAYVDSVYPDGGITISEIGHPQEGVYAERTLAKEEWKELRPIFIGVT